MSTASATAPAAGERRGFPGLAGLQRLGRSLMLPIASLPAAALLLRLGQNDMLGGEPGTVPEGLPSGLAQYDGLHWLQPVAEVIGAAGNAIFANLPVIFAIGMARRSDGSTALAGLIGYLVFKGVGDAMSPHVIGRPDLAAAEGLVEEGAAPADIAAAIEQSLINFGVLGGPTAGTFMTGFFPIMMFALPAAALAIWHTARPAQKKVVGGIMLAAALTSFVTGVTEETQAALGEEAVELEEARVGAPAAAAPAAPDLTTPGTTTRDTGFADVPPPDTTAPEERRDETDRPDRDDRPPGSAV